MALRSAADCEREGRRIYSEDLPIAGGTIHVTSVWRDSDDRFWSLAIDESMPQSETDRFVLGLARARADAILTTGRILRLEPDQTFALHSDPDVAAALADWRAGRLGRAPSLPRVVILTSGDGLPWDHPIFLQDSRRPPALILTDVEGSGAIADAASRAGVEVRARPHPGLLDGIEVLRGDLGMETVSIEAGASTTRPLYAASETEIDELLLSVFDGAELPEANRGPEFATPAQIRAAFPESPSSRESRERSGPWRFLRYRRMEQASGRISPAG